jgi:hypothetical protein
MFTLQKQLILITVIAISVSIFSACSSKNNNPTDPVVPTSAINGTWQSWSKTYTGTELTDSLAVDLNLQEENGVVTGSGTVNALFQDSSSTTISVTMTGNVTGTYSNPNINLVFTSSISDDKYTYSGSWERTNENFKGTASVTTLDKTYIFSESSLFIKK